MTSIRPRGCSGPWSFCRHDPERFPAARLEARCLALLPRRGSSDRRDSRARSKMSEALLRRMTRSQKYLQMTWAPVPGKNNRYTRASDFGTTSSLQIRQATHPRLQRAQATTADARAGVANVVFSFSDLKYFFECPTSSNCASCTDSMHRSTRPSDMASRCMTRWPRFTLGQFVVTSPTKPRSRVGRDPSARAFAYPALRQQLEASAERVIRNYLRDNRALFDKIEFSEKQIQLNLGNGVSVIGRIDLVRRIDTGETTMST